MLHVFACCWVNIGREPNSWVTTRAAIIPDRESDWTVYEAGLYWACTVFATVGYGDITGNKTQDYIFTMAVYVLGDEVQEDV